jgi:hypothetical protein
MAVQQRQKLTVRNVGALDRLSASESQRCKPSRQRNGAGATGGAGSPQPCEANGPDAWSGARAGAAGAIDAVEGMETAVGADIGGVPRSRLNARIVAQME